MENKFHDFHRGEIYFASLDPVYGHEQGGTRPVLILQNDVGNFYSPTVIVTAATRRTFKKPTEEQMERIDAALRVSLRLDEDAFLPVDMEAP